MSGIKISTTGKLGEVANRLRKYAKLANNTSLFEKYAAEGLEALKNATPVDSGVTKESWTYTIEREKGKVTIRYLNNHNAVTKTGYEIPIVILLHYGHATRGGGWVEGNNFINEALTPIFDNLIFDIANELKED